MKLKVSSYLDFFSTGQDDLAKSFFDQHKVAFLNYRGDDGKTLLSHAIESNQAFAVCHLLQEGIHLTNADTRLIDAADPYISESINSFTRIGEQMASIGIITLNSSIERLPQVEGHTNFYHGTRMREVSDDSLSAILDIANSGGIRQFSTPTVSTEPIGGYCNNGGLCFCVQVSNDKIGDDGLVKMVGDKVGSIVSANNMIEFGANPSQVFFIIPRYSEVDAIFPAISEAQLEVMKEIKSKVGVFKEHAGLVADVVLSASMMGLQVDKAKVAEMLEKGGPDNGIFTGKVVAVDRDNGFVYQSAGRGAGVVLSLASLSRVPEPGEDMTVRYKGGQGVVEAQHHGHAKAHGR